MSLKEGDLVMIISAGTNPATAQYVGCVRRIKARSEFYEDCKWLLDPPTIGRAGKTIAWHSKRLKKFDPPAEGDSLPTRVNLEMPA